MSWLIEPDEDWDPVDDEPPRRSRLRLVALLLGGWLAVSLLVLVGLLAFGGHSGRQHQTSPRSTPPASGSTASAAHSYGQVQTFFAKTPCSSVHRLLATTKQGGRTVVIASNVVTFDTAGQAARYLALVNSDGTGNINDLLREGVGFSGAPSKLPEAAFASRQSGGQVWVAEAGYLTGSSATSDPALKAIAEAGVAAS
jgi:hypothetical protein